MLVLSTSVSGQTVFCDCTNQSPAVKESKSATLTDAD